MALTFIKRKRTYQEARVFEGCKPSEADFNVLYKTSVVLYDEDTKQLLCMFIKNAIDEQNVQLAKDIYGTIDQKMFVSITRNTAAGKVSLPELQKVRKDIAKITKTNKTGTTAEVELFDGRVMTQKYCNPVKSYTAGYTYWRFQGKVAMPTGFTKQYPDDWNKSLPFFNAIGNVFQQSVPKVDEIHRIHMKGFEEYLIGTSSLSTVAINVNYESAYHVDRGDLKDGYSTLTVVRCGNYDGGYYVLPEYEIAFDLAEGDMLISQSHKYWHGNTPIVKHTENAQRISFVTYLKKHIPKCTVRK